MRVLLAHMQFGRSYMQGGERYVSTLAAGLRRRGHEVAILAGDPLHLDRPRRLGECVDDGLGLYAYPTHGWMTVGGVSAERLLPFLRRWRPDVIHLNTAAHIGVGLAGAAKQLGIPLVVTAHDFWWTCPKGTLLRADQSICEGSPGWSACIQCIGADHEKPALRSLAGGALAAPFLLAAAWGRAALRGMGSADMHRWLHRREYLRGVLSAADAAICPSQTMRDVLCAAGFTARWCVIRNGISSDWFSEGRSSFGAVKPPEELVIGFAGAVAPHKGPHLLLEAMRLLGWNRSRVIMAGPVGDRFYRARLEAAGRGLSVEFAGSLSSAEMKSFLRGIDILAVTSLWLENCPYVVLEGQAAGARVVGPDRGGVAELISEPGLRFPLGSAPGLAAALEYARSHPGIRGCGPVPTEEQMTAATEEVYREALERRCGQNRSDQAG